MAYPDDDDLKAILGTGSLYQDAVYQQVVDAAKNTVLAVLTRYKSSVDEVARPTGTSIFMRTTTPHQFYVGQGVTLAGFVPGQLNGTATVTSVGFDSTVPFPATPWPSHFNGRQPFNTLTVTKAHGQAVVTQLRPEIPNATVFDTDEMDFYDDVPEVFEAILAVAVDIWQSRVAPGGTTQAVDFQPGPYRMGRSLISRVQGLIAQHMDTGSLAY